MATKKKLLQAAAGTAAAGGGAGALNVEDVFSTYLYVGNNDNGGNTQTITNGIDLDGEGGLVWVKSRSGSSNHIFVDTERGVNNALRSNSTSANTVYSGDAEVVNGFNSNGFDIGEGGQVNYLNTDYASWTFRKAPRFFDCVTWTGDGSASGQILNHDLGCDIGTIIIKRTDSTSDWIVASLTANNQDYYYNLRLNTTAAGSGPFNYRDSTTYPLTSTQFTTYIGGASGLTNTAGATYVAYLFAHNDGDGEFGDGTQDIIKCGSYTGTGSSNFIDLGFEPQWVLVKKTSGTAAWELSDNMRGLVGGYLTMLEPNSSAAEVNAASTSAFSPNPTGMTIDGGGSSTNQSGQTYIYIAIRRGPMAVPTDATEVFGMDFGGTTSPSPPLWNSGFPVDMAFYKNKSNTESFFISSRLTQGKHLKTDTTDAEASAGSIVFDYQNGYYNAGTTLSNYISWMWKRAPSFFDVVAYSGNGTAGRTVSHNLGVAPEMMWIKKRNSAYEWIVYSPAGDGYLRLNTTEAYATSNVLWNATSPTSTEFTLGGYTHVNGSGDTYIAYLFASVDGVSKVGSYTGNGTSQTIDCGFSSGARFVLIKRTSGPAGWFVFDTERGIVAGDDPYLFLNDNLEELTSLGDAIDPNSVGFDVVSSNADINGSGENYIFYAIA
jgi:hypothetical protein